MFCYLNICLNNKTNRLQDCKNLWIISTRPLLNRVPKQSPRVVSKYARIDIENFAKYIGNSTRREFWKIKSALHEIVDDVYCIRSEGVYLIYIVYMCVFRIFLCKTHMGPHIWLAFKAQKWTTSHKKSSLHEKSPNMKFFCSLFSCIRTEYNKIWTTEDSVLGHFSHIACVKEQVRLRKLTLSWRRLLLYGNQFIDLQSKSMSWFLYNKDLRHERVKEKWSYDFNLLEHNVPRIASHTFKILLQILQDF